jgi:hypothetical protein
MVLLRVVFRDKFGPLDDDVEDEEHGVGTSAKRPGWRAR